MAQPSPKPAPRNHQDQRGHGGGRSPRPGQQGIPATPQAVEVTDPRYENLMLPDGPDEVNTTPAPELLARGEKGTVGQ